MKRENITHTVAIHGMRKPKDLRGHFLTQCRLLCCENYSYFIAILISQYPKPSELFSFSLAFLTLGLDA